MYIHEAKTEHLNNLLELYTHLNDNPYPESSPALERLWADIMANERFYILLGSIGQTMVSSLTIIIIDNLTHQQRPYALIENVVTHPSYRKKGYASQLLAAAKKIAEQYHCYKIMLMTGSKEQSTLDFYRQAGYNSDDKTAFIQWLS